jgi:hypothetical protein
MPKIIASLKAHHFFPKSKTYSAQIKNAIAPPFYLSPEYRSADVVGISSFTFPADHYPRRVDDIFVEKGTSKVLLNKREAFYEYNATTRTITFDGTLTEQHKIHWLDFSKLRTFYQHWEKIDLTTDLQVSSKQLLQGISPVVKQPQNITYIPRGGSVYFSGLEQDYVELRNYTSNIGTANTNFTIEAWINPYQPQEGEEYCILSNWASSFSSPGAFQIRLDHEGKLIFYSSRFYNFISTQNVINFNEWNHIAICSGYTIDGVFPLTVIMVNGKIEASTYEYDMALSNNILFGRYFSSATDTTPTINLKYRGFISNVRIVTRSRDATNSLLYQSEFQPDQSKLLSNVFGCELLTFQSTTGFLDTSPLNHKDFFKYGGIIVNSVTPITRSTADMLDYEDYVVDSIVDQPGTFQGAFRCEIQIDTLPLYGMVCLNNEKNAFMYRSSIQSLKPYDTFQFRLVNHLGQESDPYCLKIRLT